MDSDESEESREKVLVGLVEKIKLIGERKSREVEALFDTGATRTSIDEKLVDELGIEKLPKKVRIKTKSSHKDYVVRDICKARLEVRGRKFQVEANVTDRSRMAYPVLIGRDVIHGNFIIDVELTHRSHRIEDLR